MIQEVEIIRLLISLGVMVFLVIRKEQLKVIPYYKILVACYSLLVVGWVFTILEGFFAPDTLNVIEHICYTIASVLLAIWCILVYKINRSAL